jgi:trigger factor
MSAVDTAATTQLDLQVKIEKPSACQRHVVVTIPRGELERYFRKAYDEIAPRADLPGFRAGKIPRKLLESRFKKTVADQVKSNLVMDSLQQITDGGEFSAIAEPDMDYGAVKLPDAGDFTFEFKIEVRPEFDTPKWDGLDLVKTEFQLSDEEVERQLVRTLDRIIPGEPVDGEAKLGDQAAVNIVFTVDSKPLSLLEEASVTIRPQLSLADCIIENFGELVAGKKEGEKVNAKVKVLETSLNESLRGVEVDAEIELLEIRRVNVENLTPVQLSQIGFDSTDELREFVRKELERQCEYHQAQLLREQITKQLTTGADWDLPPATVRRQADRELHRRVLEMKRNQFSDDQIRIVINSMRRNIEQMTREALREHFVLEKIAEDLKIDPTEAEYEEEINLIAERSDASPRQVRNKLERNGQMDAIRNQILERTVINRIVEAAKVSSAKGDSILKEDPKEYAVEFLVAPVSALIPEAKYDSRPEDAASDKDPVKPT